MSSSRHEAPVTGLPITVARRFVNNPISASSWTRLTLPPSVRMRSRNSSKLISTIVPTGCRLTPDTRPSVTPLNWTGLATSSPAMLSVV